MRWRFDDITVETPERRIRRTQWYHGYDLSLLGPLGHPVVGSFDSKANFSDGADLDQTVNTLNPRQQRLGMSINAQIFRPEVRKYLRIDPNLSMSNLRMLGDANRTVQSRSWGWSTGLSLPRLPALSVSRQFSTLRDPSEAGPMDQRTTTGRESLSYGLGPVKLRLDHDNSRIEDRLGISPTQESDQRRASLETSLYQLKRIPLEAFVLRTEYSRYASNGMVVQKDMTNTLNVRTNKFMLGGWENAIGYGNTLVRDHIEPVTDLSQNAVLESNRGSGMARFRNSVDAAQNTGRNFRKSANDGASLTLSFASGTVVTNTGASAGWSRGESGEFLNDGLNGQVTFSPPRPYTLFIEARTNGTKPINDAVGGGRTNRYTAGTTVRPGQFWSVTGRFDRTHTRDYASETRTVIDQIDLRCSAVPLERLNLDAGLNLSVASPSSGSKTVTRTIQGGAEYSFLSGVRLSAETTHTDAGYTAAMKGSYMVGKTEFSVKYERRELSTPAAFSHLSIGLSRYF